MAENESLDLGSSYAKRWGAAFTAVQNGDSCEKVAAKVSKALYGGVAIASDGSRNGFAWARLLVAPDHRNKE